jgi:hypothetical protein
LLFYARGDNVAKCSKQRLHYDRKNGKTTRLTDEGVTRDNRQQTRDKRQLPLRANLLSKAKDTMQRILITTVLQYF